MLCTFAASASCAASSGAQRSGAKAPTPDRPLSEKTFKTFKLRNIGPGLMSGRIADIAIHPNNNSVWYVGVGSGGVWKTVNAGTTWTPVFDKQSVYSIGAVTIDPVNPSIVWVGTGEDVGGRHVSFGDGVYKSLDGGKNWKNVGLKKSEHITDIIVHPKDSNVVYVASQGPLWSKGGDRGLFKTTDGGKRWSRVLGAGPWTGISSVVMDPRNPDVLYAATWQHHRTVAAYVGSGPETAIHRTTDGGKTWTKLKEGLPKKTMGKIGLALSPQNPDIVYASITLHRTKTGVWRSSDRGATWVKGAKNPVPMGTGPHYYMELYASPHEFERLFFSGPSLGTSTDGGKTFKVLKSGTRHGDHHAMAFRPDDPNYMILGTDGGLYESFDRGKTWRFIANLPVTQFYKVAVDDAEPFYNVYGGTQDNFTQGGPSRTDNANGIRNADWFVTLSADGHQPATEPGNPDIMYSEFQRGNLFRIDRTTGERTYIQPQPPEGKPAERFNWDAPILISPHSPTRLYVGSQRVWRSDNRGDSWTSVSPDLTRNQNRMLLPLMDKQWSWDAAWDMVAMSTFNTITSLAESPKQEGLLYAGTDDGIIQVSENGGKTWRRIEVAKLPGVPRRAFVNDIKADMFDANTVYVALDNHKEGDFKPYLLKSTNRGATWRSITGDLPERHLVWRLVQDHVNPNLLFVGTEFGIFFTVDGGKVWTKLSGGVPTISFRDLAIQRRENDLVGASFGRGFFVLDDYAPLRNVSAKSLEQKAMMFPVRDAWWYLEKVPLGQVGQSSQGDGYYVAPNPPFGAVFTYYLKAELKTQEQTRQDREKKLLEKKPTANTPFPGWDAVEAERREPKPAVLIVVRNQKGEAVRRLSGPTKAGVHRISWDLRYPASEAIGFPTPPWRYPNNVPRGHLTTPGEYSATLYLQQNGKTEQVGQPVAFTVKRLTKGALPGATPADTVAFWRRVSALNGALTATRQIIKRAEKTAKDLATALARAEAGPESLDQEVEAFRLAVDDIKRDLFGVPSRSAVGESGPDTVSRRLGVVSMGTTGSTYGPTPTHKNSLEIAERAFEQSRAKLNKLLSTDLPALEAKLRAAGAPWTDGQPVPAVKP